MVSCMQANTISNLLWQQGSFTVLVGPQEFGVLVVTILSTWGIALASGFWFLLTQPSLQLASATLSWILLHTGNFSLYLMIAPDLLQMLQM